MKPGDSIDIWVVDEALGTGGMGSVYKCHNRSAKRILAAIKVLESSLRGSEGAQARFIREAEILFTLDHPNIVKVRNVRTDLDPPYLEMEFVQGISLEEILRDGSLSWDRALPLFQQLVDAVAYLHARGVRHRDIKPANLLVQADGTLKLVDFGLAMEADRSRLTQSNTTFGTVSYAPPEWVSPELMDPTKWDVYACGVVLWEMLRGEVAFPVSGQGSARQQAMQVIIAKQSYPALDPGPAWRTDVRELLRSLTHPDPAHRPDSMVEVQERVAALDPSPQPVVGETITPPPAPSPEAATLVDDAQGMREDWAQALKATPPPTEPKAHRPPDSEARTLVREGERRSLFRRGWIVAAAVAVLLALGAAGGWLAMTGLLPGSTAPTTRPVEVVVSGVEPGTPVQVALDGRPAASRTSWVFGFPSAPVGDTTLTWVMGEDCPLADCPGTDCPAWCGAGEQPLAIEPGQEPRTVELALPAPPQRAVEVVFTALDRPHPLAATLGERTRSEQSTALDLGRYPPGRHRLRTAVGDCPPATGPGCHPDGDCPPGCVTWSSTVVIPWAQGPHRIEVPVPAPLPRAAPAPAPRTASAPGSRQEVPASIAGPPEPSPGTAAAPEDDAAPPVTAAAYATWLADQPDWHPTAAREAGLADEEYLQGWTGLEPPTPGRAVRHVPWYAASAYCEERGGLAPLDAPPLTWSEGPDQPYLEWRSADGQPAWRRADGATSTRVRLDDASSFAGFRCHGVRMPTDNSADPARSAPTQDRAP